MLCTAPTFHEYSVLKIPFVPHNSNSIVVAILEPNRNAHPRTCSKVRFRNRTVLHSFPFVLLPSYALKTNSYTNKYCTPHVHTRSQQTNRTIAKHVAPYHSETLNTHNQPWMGYLSVDGWNYVMSISTRPRSQCQYPHQVVESRLSLPVRCRDPNQRLFHQVRFQFH